MSTPGSINELLIGAAGAAGAGYEISRSLRFNSADSAYLSRTPASAGNRKTWTISLWIKRCKLGVLQSFTSCANDTIFLFDANDKLSFYLNAYVRTSTQVFRDTSAWYHIVLAVDTTNATAQNRVRMYVNNNEITVWDTNTTVTQNVDTTWNAAFAHQIGANNTSQFANQYIADFHNIDGQALTPSSFAKTNATTGQWVPKAYTGTFGTNGFWLKFSDNSAATATTLGKDYSGNGNNWTPNNLSVTAGAGNDSLVDTPTSYGTPDTGVGGEVRGNYCTLNPLVNAAYNTYSNGSLECAFPAATTGATAVGTLAVSSGKWYWELNRNDSSAGLLAGIARIDTDTINLIGSNATSYAYKDSNGNKINNGTSTAYGATWNNTNIIGVALDLDAGTLVFYKDGVSQGTAFSGLSGTFYPAFSEDSAGSGSGVAANFGQRPFAYPVSGFKALCDTNLPAPVVAKPSTVMDVLTWTGNGGGSRSFTGLNFSPDLAWVKTRSVGYTHVLWDSVRGAGVSKELQSDSTNAEGGASTNNSGYLSSFNSDGFSSTAGSTDNDYFNRSATTYVAWAWDAGSSTVTNTQGSITSQVRAKASAGFSIVTYTGTGAAGTIGHGLNVSPEFIIVKDRGSSADWHIWHSRLNNGVNAGQYVLIFTTASTYGPNSVWWNNTTPSSTVFSVGGGSGTSGSGSNYVAYCFSPVAGYSSMGSYVGNGSTDGPFVFLGFRPAIVLVKMSSSTGNWTILDDKREGYNVDNDPLYPNLANIEDTTDLIDITSNGFKVRTTDATFNTNTGTYVYAAWASSPFQYARAR